MGEVYTARVRFLVANAMAYSATTVLPGKNRKGVCVCAGVLVVENEKNRGITFL